MMTPTRIERTESAESHPMSQGSATCANKSQHEDDFASANSESCTVCNAVFSKRKLRLRYQCGICERSVCSACSPSNVQLEGCTGMQRACKPCIANAAKAPAIQSRVIRLGEQLVALGEIWRQIQANGGKWQWRQMAANYEQLDALDGKCTGSSSVKCTNLEEAVNFSESAVAPLVDLRDRLAAEMARSEKLEKILEIEMRFRHQLEQELREKKKIASSCSICGSIEEEEHENEEDAQDRENFFSYQ